MLLQTVDPAIGNFLHGSPVRDECALHLRASMGASSVVHDGEGY